MHGTPYIFHFVHPLVKTAEIMVHRVNFERNLKNIRPPTVQTHFILNVRQDLWWLIFENPDMQTNFE